MLNKNEIIKIKITDINSEGFGVGRFDGIVVFVPYAALEEEVLCRVEKISKNFCHARITEVITPSNNRIEPDCPVYYRCGGCSFRHIDYDAEIGIKKNTIDSAFKKIAKVSLQCEDIIPSPSTVRYRNKAQLVVRQIEGKTRTGFFAPRSHRFIPIEDCLLQPEIFTCTANICCSFLDDNNIPSYNEENNSGMIRHILLRYSESTSDLMVCIVSRKEFDCSKLSKILSESIQQNVTVLLNINPDRTNVILGKKTNIITGRGKITEQLFGINYDITPYSFFQVNTKGALLLYNTVKLFALPKKQDKVLDLYCGVGSIGLSISDKSQSLLGVDIVKPAIISAIKNAKRAGFINAKFIAGEAYKGLIADFDPDIVILDPPRKGLDENTIEQLLSILPNKIVMVSCNPATAARDVSKLLNSYNIERLIAVDMFARCAHVECVVLLTLINS